MAVMQVPIIPFSFDSTKAIRLAEQHELDLSFTRPSSKGLRSLPEFNELKTIFPKTRNVYTPDQFKQKLAEIEEKQDKLKQNQIMLAKKKEALDYLYDLVKLQMMDAFYASLNKGKPLEEVAEKPLASWGKRFKCYLLAGLSTIAEGADGFFGIHDFFSTILRISHTALNVVFSAVGFLLKAFAYTAVEVRGFKEEMGCSKEAILPRFKIHEKMLVISQAINNKLSSKGRLSIFKLTQLFGLSIFLNEMMGKKNKMNAFEESENIKRKRLWVGRACALVDGIFSFVVVQNFFLMLGLAFSWSPAGWGLLIGCVAIASVTAFLEYKSSMPLGFFKFFNPYAEMQNRLKANIDVFNSKKCNKKEWKLKKITNIIHEEINVEAKSIMKWLVHSETFEHVITQDINEKIQALILKVREVERNFGANPLEPSHSIFMLKKSLKALIDLSLEVKCRNILLKIDHFQKTLLSGAVVDAQKINELQALFNAITDDTLNDLLIKDDFYHLEKMKFNKAKGKISAEIESLKNMRNENKCEQKPEVCNKSFYSCTNTTSNLFHLQRRQPEVIELTKLSPALECK